MASVYKIVSSGKGVNWCGHRQKKGEMYYLLYGRTVSKSFCKECGDRAKMGGRHVTIGELIDMGVLYGNKDRDVTVQAKDVGAKQEVAVGGVAVG